MKTKVLIGSAALSCLFLLSVIPKASAIALSINDSYTLGYITPDNPANPASEVTYINAIIGLTLGGSTTVGGDTVYRSMNSFSPLDPATFLSSPGTLTTTTIVIPTGGAEYLAAKYDGPNYGTEVWYIGGFAAGTTITIPAGAGGSTGDKYGLSGVNLFTHTSYVPDGGSTALLIGAAISALGLIRRKLS